MAKQINVGVGGVVKTVKEVPISIGGVVKKAQKGVCGVGGVVKTFYESELVLWDGSSVQNGAKWYGSNTGYNLDYAFDKGALNNKTLVIKFKKSVTACVDIITMATHNYLDAVGNVINSGDGYDSSWKTSTEYVYSCSKLKSISSVTSMRIQLTSISAESALDLRTYINYIALK